MKCLLRFFIVCFSVVSSTSFAFSNQDSLVNINKIVEQTQQLLEFYPIEKAYLHFDKPYYAVGDTVWFKGYMNTNLHTYEASKIMYVEVLSSKDSLIQTLKMPLIDFVGKGQLVLDQKWFKQDNYRFRAYTKWMGNFDPDYFFNQVIPVGDVLNDHLHTQLSFEENKQGKVLAKLQFSNRAGNAFANSRINWETVSNFAVLEKGKGTTDAMGNFSFEINVKDKELLKKAILNVSLQESSNSNLLIGDFPLQAAVWDVDIQFFPEGGDLIAGVSKKVAFKALASNGKGMKLQGELLDGQGKSVLKFNDLHAGMGYFELNPEENQSYKAKFTFDNGEERTVNLPTVKKEGISLKVAGMDDKNLHIQLITNDGFLKQFQQETFNIVAQSNGILCYAAQAPLKDKVIEISLPKERFPTGVAQVTLFNAKGEAISERLVFVENIKPLDLDVKLEKTSYGAKELVNMMLNVTNNDSTFAGSYSVSVTDELKVPVQENDESTILSNMLLTSDLKGHVEQANYYFNQKNENRVEALDALLMTQGYKRFLYADVLAGRLPQVLFLPETSMEISGTLRLNNGRTVPNGGLLLSIPDRTFRTDVYTDDQGRFRFTGLNFTDSSRVTINARGNDNYRNMVIHVDQTSFPGINSNPDWAAGVRNIDQVMKSYLDNSRKIFRTDVLIDEVEVTAKAGPSRSHRDYPNIAGLSVADHQINGEKLSNCANLIMCLQTALMGITYNPQSQLFYITRDYNAGGRIPVQFFINGMPVDVIALNSVLPGEIESIDIFMKDELGVVSRTYQNNGVVAIYTKTTKELGTRMSLSELESLFPKANVVDLTPLGYLKEYEFYSPKYETPESKSVNDFRATVYWNPMLVTDEEGKATISYYNADGKGWYRVVIEGMDATGNIGRTVYRYEVK